MRNDDDLMHEVNSRDYWERRFREDWEISGGSHQTAFFGALALSNLPQWLMSDIQVRRLSICDWGCALGQSTELLSRAFRGSHVIGVDISETAVEKARALYPSLTFQAVDFLAHPGCCDVFFASNTLEHFENPYSVLSALEQQYREYFIMMVPFYELCPHPEHLYHFRYDTIRTSFGNDSILIWCKPIDAAQLPETQWQGEQVLLVYARRTRLDAIRLSGAASKGLFADGSFVASSMEDATERIAEEILMIGRVWRGARKRERESRLEIARITAEKNMVIDEMRAEVARLAAERHSEIERLTAEKEADVARLAAEAAAFRDILVNKDQELVKWRTALSEANERIRLASASLKLVKRSTWWRCMRPVRWLQSYARAKNAHHLCMPKVVSVETNAYSATSREPPYLSSLFGPALGTQGLVSIILPVYNQARYLATAIQSIQAQTWPNWELIVVNDGSCDDFDGAIAPFLSDARIRVFQQPNQKLPSALNNGFRHARGSYLTWTSADNITLPNQIAELMKALEDNPTAGLAYSDYEAIDDCGAPLADPIYRPHNRPDGSALVRLPSVANISTLHESGDNFLGPSFMYRADVAAVVGPYSEATFGGEDYDFWLRANLVTSFVHVNMSLYRYRVHSETLNAKAKELGLFTNIQRLLGDDRRRRQELLIHQTLANSGPSLWRNPEQYRAEIVAIEQMAYSELAGNVARRDVAIRNCSRVCIIDVELAKLDLSLLKNFDIIVTNDELIVFWLKTQTVQPCCRVLFGDADTLAPVIAHCSALRYFERRQARDVQSANFKPAASLYPASAPKHVMLLADHWGEGGLENVITDLARGLALRSVRVTIGLAQERLPQSLVNLASNGIIAEPVSFHGDPLAMASFLSEQAVDIVNLHHTTWGLKGPLKAVPTLYTLHNSYLWFTDDQRRHWRDMLAYADNVIAVSRQVAAYARSVFSLDCTRLTVVPNGVSLDKELPHGGRSSTRIRFVNVATFTRLKMQDQLLRAFAVLANQHQNVELVMVGSQADTKYFAQVEEVAREMGDQVKLIGALARKDVHELIASADVFVLPSLVEGWSLALTEAAMLGKPIIASDVGGARDLKKAGAAVLLVQPIDLDHVGCDSAALNDVFTRNHDTFVRDLTSAMVTFTDAQQQFREQARDAALAIRREYSVEKMVDGYLQQFALARSMHAQRFPL